MKKYPTPIAGLALGISGITLFWSVCLPMFGKIFICGCCLASLLILPLIMKFIRHPSIFWDELKHPVLGSVIPTMLMTTMILSKLLAKYAPLSGEALWLLAVMMHIVFCSIFIVHQIRQFDFRNIIPAWYVPPIGMVVSCLTVPNSQYLPLAHGILILGIIAFLLMLPIVLSRLILSTQIPAAQKPTLAILAAPGSLTLAGYLTVVHHPNPLLVVTLFGIAVAMTICVYIMMFHLLRLPFSPAFSAYTFPLAISATAMYKFSLWASHTGLLAHYAHGLWIGAIVEAILATSIILFVMLKYMIHFGMSHYQSISLSSIRLHKKHV